jgi:thiol-disulfide isomerase/thioredoxin
MSRKTHGQIKLRSCSTAKALSLRLAPRRIMPTHRLPLDHLFESRNSIMAKPQRSLILIVVPIVLIAGGLAFGDGLFSRHEAAAKEQGQNGLQQAADSIVAAAKERVAAAKTDDEAIERAHMSLEALRLVGALGEFDTAPQADRLLDALAASGRPAVVEALIRLRLNSALQRWDELGPAERTAAINGFVSGVKKAGLTPNHARVFMRLPHMLPDDGKLIATAIKEILPLARDSQDAQLKRMAVIFDGVVRRLELPGKPIEIEGTLLDGSKFDWNSYRGKVVLIDFHASWCGPCRDEVPNILRNYRAYHDKGFEVIGVNLDKDPNQAQQYVNQTGFRFPIIFGADPGARGWDLPLARKYGITGIPQVILVGADGNVVSTHARGERLGELLGELLGPSGQPNAKAAGRTEDPSVTPAGGTTTDTGGVVPSSAEEPVEAAPAVPEESAAPEPPK